MCSFQFQSFLVILIFLLEMVHKIIIFKIYVLLAWQRVIQQDNFKGLATVLLKWNVIFSLPSFITIIQLMLQSLPWKLCTCRRNCELYWTRSCSITVTETLHLSYPKPVQSFPCFLNWALRREGVLGEWRYSCTRSLTSTLDGDEWSASCPGRFTPREGTPVTHRIGVWVGPRAALDAVILVHIGPTCIQSFYSSAIRICPEYVKSTVP
jgi:hypothetical protein